MMNVVFTFWNWSKKFQISQMLKIPMVPDKLVVVSCLKYLWPITTGKQCEVVLVIIFACWLIWKFEFTSKLKNSIVLLGKIKRFTSGGSKGAPRNAPPEGPKCSQFLAVFREIWQNHMLTPLSWRIGALSYGESWIRPCSQLLKLFRKSK